MTARYTLILALVWTTSCIGEMAFDGSPIPETDGDTTLIADTGPRIDNSTNQSPPQVDVAVPDHDADGAEDDPIDAPDAGPTVDAAPPIECGNSIIEDGEVCDPPSSCPTSCPNNACEVGTLLGSADECTARCSYETITTCTNGDGCCAAGCSFENDDDCPLDCRNDATWPAGWKAFETETIALMNQHRAAGANCGAHGDFGAAPALTMNTNIRQAARCHSVDMWEHQNMSHTGSDGSTFSQRMTREGYAWSAAAENVARGQASPSAVVSAWMNSDGHCRNIMNANYQHVGIGHVHRYWTAKYGR
ncbi:MAG: CAP domain-containing protein, partial [Bradymonadaceae bacterium]